MIPALIIWLIKKYYKGTGNTKIQASQSAGTFKKTIRIFMFLISFSMPVLAQQQLHQYNIVYKGDNIGKMYLSQQQVGDELHMKMVSAVEMRMLMKIKVDVKEESYFKQNKLVTSSVYRTVNGKEKANKFTTATDSFYQTSAEGKKGVISTNSIAYNLMMIYCKEPVNVVQVYSDNFQKFLTIKSLSPHRYKIELPDGNYNIYHYSNGICNKVEVHNSLFTIQMNLSN